MVGDPPWLSALAQKYYRFHTQHQTVEFNLKLDESLLVKQF